MSDIDGTSNMPVDSDDLSAADSTDVVPQVVAARLSVGALLAETRSAAGRDLVDVARETRVPLRHLMAIEADDHRSLPALPFARGFVKSYARSLGLNSDAVAAQFRAETSITPHVPTPLIMEPLAEARLPSRGLAWGSVVVLVALIGALGLYGAGVFDPTPAPVDASLAETNPAEIAGTETAADPATEVAPAQAEAAPPASDPAVAPAAVPAAPAAPSIPVSGPVVLVAQEDVWVEIYDRSTGRRAFMGVLAAGQRYEVPVDGPPLTLRAGRAGMVQVQVAGVALPSLGGSVSTIDGVVLTAPALAARFAPPPPAEIAAPNAASPASAAAARQPVQPPASQAGAQSRQQPAPTRPAGSPIGD
jgi:cytoskeletal protein RodZ